MKKVTIIGLAVIIVFLVIGFFAFNESKIEYSNFQNAEDQHRTCQVKGSWVKDKGAEFNAGSNEFVFYMIDENNTEAKVILAGAKPNNFEMAESIVAKGKFHDGSFYAKEVLTKCPSKYEGKGEDVKHSGMN